MDQTQCDRSENFDVEDEPDMLGPSEDYISGDMTPASASDLDRKIKENSVDFTKDIQPALQTFNQFKQLMNTHLQHLSEHTRVLTYMTMCLKIGEKMMSKMNPQEKSLADMYRIVIYASQVISPLYKTMLKIVQQAARHQNTSLYASNSLGVYEHRIFLNGLDKQHMVQPSTNTRKYEFRDLDFAAAAKTTCRKQMLDAGRYALLVKSLECWGNAASFDDFLYQIEKQLRGQIVMPLTQTTIVNWTTKMVVQRYIHNWLYKQWDQEKMDQVAQARHQAQMDMQSMHPGTPEYQQQQKISMYYLPYELLVPGANSDNIVHRACAYRSVMKNQIEVPEPPKNSRESWAWYYWVRLKGRDFAHRFLKQLVLCGPKSFTERPVVFLSGGRMGKGAVLRADDMTMDKLTPYIEALTQNPVLALKDLEKNVSASHIQSFLHRIGIRQRQTKRMDERLGRDNVRADMRRFAKWVQQQHTVGQDVDAVWMDETTISPHAVHSTAWGLQGDSTPVYGAKYTGGIYNMMLSMGNIGEHTFVHYMIYKPQHKTVSVVASTLVGTGPKVKTYGVYATILNYLFNHWGENLQDSNFAAPVQGEKQIECYLEEVVMQQQNLDPLADFLAAQRKKYNRENQPLMFMWDSFSAHFAQKIQDSNHRAVYNHGGDLLRAMFEAKGVQHVQMILLPRHTSQFNPCERIFALLKQHLKRSSAQRNKDQLPETQLYDSIHDFIDRMKDSTVSRLIYACKYNINQWTPHQRGVRFADSKTCNNPSTRVSEPSDEQLVCASKESGIISKYLAPGSKRWHVLSPLSTLFEPQKSFVLSRFTDHFWDHQHDISPDLSAHYYTYSGYGLDHYVQLDEAAKRQYTSAQARIKWIQERVYGSTKLDQIVRIPASYWLLVLILMGIHNRWALVPGVIKVKQQSQQDKKKFIERVLMVYRKYVNRQKQGQVEMYALVSTSARKTADINFMFGRLTPVFNSFSKLDEHLSALLMSRKALTKSSILLIPGDWDSTQIQNAGMRDISSMMCDGSDLEPPQTSARASTSKPSLLSVGPLPSRPKVKSSTPDAALPSAALPVTRSLRTRVPVNYADMEEEDADDSDSQAPKKRKR
jgi:hypothetical protein